VSRVPLLPDFPRPLLFAHRGCSSLAPENTMAAFALARELGAPGLELDVRRCATGELVVAHDDTFSRTAGLDAEVEALPYARIAGLDAGAFFGPDFSGERVPLLDEVLDEFAGSLYLDIELKTRKTRDDPLPGALAAALRDRARSRPELERSVVVSSFNPLALYAFKRAAPRFATAIIWDGGAALPFYLRRGQGRWLSRCDYLKPQAGKAGRLSVALLSRVGGRPAVAWTVDDAPAAERLLEAGCEGLITNRPQDLLPLIRSAAKAGGA
jgi:glycerophosphoryl diester phosphodiesterase